jgi:hypothetical protein
VDFTITLHSGFAAPPDALDRLWERLGHSRGEAQFAMGAAAIRATWGADVAVSMERDEREGIGRLAVLEIVRDICEQTPELKLDWFAVSVRR